MNDLIRRSDAIEEIARRDTTDGTVKVFSGREVADILHNLPTVSRRSIQKWGDGMSDLISRQAAIDTMCELMRHWFGCDSKDEIREIKRELDKLPSAQPEIIMCKDCDNYEGDGRYCAWDILTGDMGYCHHARPKGGTAITDEQTERSE